MKIKIITAALFSTCIGLQAQTTNQGMLYVGENTQFSTLGNLDNRPAGSFINDGEAFIYQGFNNDGIVDFYGETGLTRFIGNSPQLISGQEPSHLNDIYFDNNSGEAPFYVIGDLNVFGQVDFYGGIVDNDNYGGSILFMDAAGHTNTSNASHVDGPVMKQGNQPFTFPIGDGGYYRFAGISESATTNTYQAKYYLENSDNLHSHDLRPDAIVLIDDNEYWTIEPVQGNEDVLITLSWDEDTTPQEIIQTPQEGAIVIVRWDDGGNSWVNEGGTVNIADRTVTTAVSGYGIYTLARVVDDTELPCGLRVFNAVSADRDGQNDFFRIEGLEGQTCATNLHVQVFNRWGVKVYESNNYGTSGDVFSGFSSGRLTIAEDNMLPTGTYYYVLEFDYSGQNDQIRRFKKFGYLFLNDGN